MNWKDRFCGVILAAGVGERIAPLNFATPKPLLPICNKPIMCYHIEYMKSTGIRDIFVVVGYLKEQIIEYFGDGSTFGVNITYVEQKAPLGIAHAVAQLEEYVDKPFLLSLGDIFFVLKDMVDIFTMFGHRRAGAVLVVKRENNLESIKKNFAVMTDEYGRVRRVIEKPRHTHSHLKGCGIYLFDLIIFDAIRQTPRTAMRDEYEITTAIQILIDGGHPVCYTEAIEWDMNVTFPQDLILCNLKQLQLMGKHNLIGRQVKLHQEARVTNSVIGNNVIVENAIQIEDSLILPCSRVTSCSDLKNTLVGPDLIIDCTMEMVSAQ